MEIPTRWRDITLAEVNVAHGSFGTVSSPDTSDWDNRRGKEVIIITPPCDNPGICGLPAFRTTSGHWACGHLAEIGD